MEVLYEDNHVIVVIKEPGILSQEDKTGDLDMLSMIKAYLKKKYNKLGNVYLGLVHRLDRNVGGIMVFGKTSKGASRLSEQIRNHTFQKKYLAVVHNKIDNSGTLINYLFKDEKSNTVYIKDRDYPQAKKAELSYELLEYKSNMSLVRIDLVTGKSHQIRVQFANINHPLMGDKKYGINDNCNYIALYAYQLSFYHPVTKELLTFTSYPKNYPFNQFTISL